MLGADELPAVAEALPAVRQIKWTRVTEIDSRYYSSLSLHKCISNCSKTCVSGSHVWGLMGPGAHRARARSV